MEPTNGTIVLLAIMTVLMFIGIVYLLAGNTGGGYGAGHSDYRYSAHPHPVESGARRAAGLLGILLRAILIILAIMLGKGLMAAGEMIMEHMGVER